MNTEHAERLLKLAAVLDTVDKKQFDMGFWLWDKEHDHTADKDYKKSLHDLMQHKCDTQACALGWACTIPEFRAAGLKIYKGTPEYKQNFGTDAAQLFFGLDWDVVDKLFGGIEANTSAVTPTQKAEQIRYFVRHGVVPDIEPE